MRPPAVVRGRIIDVPLDCSTPFRCHTNVPSMGPLLAASGDKGASVPVVPIGSWDQNPEATKLGR
jgi:hypothetical protein